MHDQILREPPETTVDTPPAPPPPGVAAMAIARWALVAVMAAVAAASIGHVARATSRARAAGAADRTRAVYYCPMHPSVVADQPGECPICSMTLVRKAEPEAGAGASRAAGSVPGLVGVELSPERIALAGLQTAPAVLRGAAVAIPAEALVDTGERRYVFVALAGGRFVPRPVKAGPRAGGAVEIRDGLSPGEIVVTTGNVLLEAESRLRAAIEGQATGTAATRGR
jgi:hypothetical protein